MRALLVVGVVLGAFALSSVTPAAAESRLGLKVNEGGRKVAVTFVPRERPVEHTIKLNGRRIEDVFDYSPPAGRTVVLGLDEGLRFGRNRLRARATYPDGKVVKRTRTFRLSTRRPLAGVAGTLRTFSGARADLRAKTKAAGEDVTHRWRLLSAPEGSKADLRRATSRRPRFRPDVPGIYRIELEARHAGAGGKRSALAATPARTDVSALYVGDAEAPKSGVFVGLQPLDSGGNPTAIEIFQGSNAGTYPIGPGNGKSGPIAALVFDRCTLALMSTVDTDAGSAGQQAISSAITTAQKNLANSGGCNPIVLVAGTGYGQLGDLAPSLATWTGQTQSEGYFTAGTTDPFWAVFMPAPLGSKSGTPGNGWSNYPAFDGTSQQGRMAGELVQAPNGSYTFRPSTVPPFGQPRLRFHADQTGITVPPVPGSDGPRVFPAETPVCPGDGKGGFQLLVLGASGVDSLDEIGIGSAEVNGQTVSNGATFWTNACNQADSEAWAQALDKVLASVGKSTGDYPTTVFIQGVGDAMPATSGMSAAQLQALRSVATQIGELGGSAEAFLSSAGQGGPAYSFVGQSWPLRNGARVDTEVASSAPGNPPARLDGYIDRDRRSRLAPTIGTSAGELLGPDLTGMQALTDVSAIVDPATNYGPVPFPGDGEEAWTDAMHDIASRSVPKLTASADSADACYPVKMDKNGYVYDIRALYCGGGEVTDCAGPWDSISIQLSSGTLGDYAPSPGSDYTQLEWNQVKAQLLEEFAIVEELNCTVLSLQSIYGGTDPLLDVTTIVATINEDIKRAESDASGIIGATFEVVSSLLNIGAAAATGGGSDAVSTALWAVAGGIDLSEEVIADAAGDPVLGPLPAGLTDSAYAQALVSELQQASSSLDLPRMQIASSWDRLQAFGESGMLIQSNDVQSAKTGLTYASYDQTWRTLIPTLYPPTHLGVTTKPSNPAPVNVPDYYCWEYNGSLQFEFQAFDGYPESAYSLVPSAPHQGNETGLEAYAFAFTSFGGDYYEPTPPPKGILDGIFEPLADPGSDDPLPPVQNGQATGLGVSQERFFAEAVASAEATGQVQELGESVGGDCPVNVG
jgi:hypothetical protein